MVTNTPVGVLALIVILPSCVDFAVVHRLLRQTSTLRDQGAMSFVTADCGWMMAYPEAAADGGALSVIGIFQLPAAKQSCDYRVRASNKRCSIVTRTTFSLPQVATGRLDL